MRLAFMMPIKWIKYIRVLELFSLCAIDFCRFGEVMLLEPQVEFSTRSVPPTHSYIFMDVEINIQN